VNQQYKWEDIIARLSHHRNRLGITKSEMVKYINNKYKRSFMQLTDDEILELGKSMASHQDKMIFLGLNQEPPEVSEKPKQR
jgi:hypothetical protein